MPGNPASLRLTDGYRTAQLGLRRTAAIRVAAMWNLNFDDLDRSFSLWLGPAAALLGAAKAGTVHLSDAYVAAFVTSETGQLTAPAGIDPAPYATLARTGRPLAAALAPALYTVKARLADGADPAVASFGGQARAVRATVEETQAAADDSLADAFDAQPAVRGWRRVTSGRACGACLAMAGGEIEEPGTPMDRHVNCGCTKEPVIEGVPDRVTRPTGSQIFDRMSAVEQDDLFAGRGGEQKAELVRSGAVDLADLVRPVDQRFGQSLITETPLEALRRR